MADFPKKYTPQIIQQEILATQNRNKLRGPKGLKVPKEKDSITVLHMPIQLEPKTNSYHEFLQFIKQDSLIRYLHMTGKHVTFRPLFSYKTSSNDYEKEIHKATQREKLIDKQKEKWIRHMIQFGCAFDETAEESLISPANSRKIRNLIVDFAKKWWIAKDYAINYRSNHAQTNIATDDIVWKKVKDKVYNIRYFVDTKNITLVVPTTSPETIFGDVALAVHPDDRRYKKLIGHKVIIPIINKTIPIIGEETIEPSSGNGIIRITPCHDKKSLEIAKKHKLKLNKFAIDHNNCFTKLAGDFSGKKVADFFDNIIQNLEDIHNMESIQQAEYEVATDKHYGERLQPIICEQRFFHKDETDTYADHMQELINTIDIQPHEEKDRLVGNLGPISSFRPISKKDSFGISLPLWKTEDDQQFFLSDKSILELPIKKLKNKKIILAMLIFNLITDQRLSANFTIEEFIDIIFSHQKSGVPLGQIYMDIFDTDLPRGYKQEINEFLKLFEYANKEKGMSGVEKFTTQLMDMLDKTFAVINRKDGKYGFNFAAMTKSEETISISDEKIDSNLATSLLLLDAGGFFTDQESKKTILFTDEKNINNAIKTILLGAAIDKKGTIDSLFVYPENKGLSEEVFEEMIEKRWTDGVRLYSIIAWTPPDKFTADDPEPYTAFINKTRNACRYIYTTYIESLKKKKQEEKKDLEAMSVTLEKKIAKSNPIEYWIVCRLKELYEELWEYRDKNDIGAYAQKVVDCIKKDFCEKYLEIIKIREDELTSQTTLFCVGMIIKLISPLSPFLAEKLWDTFNFKGTLTSQRLAPFFQKENKNYKTQLFMDIIDRFTALREKIQQPRHQKVDICFSASIDFLHYIRSNEDIIQKLVNTEKIEYIDKEKDLQKYETDSIIDVTIGMRWVSKPIKEEDTSYLLKQTLERKKEELQKLRNITAKLSLDKSEKKKINIKKEEMSLLKADIEKLEYEISKTRINKK